MVIAVNGPNDAFMTQPNGMTFGDSGGLYYSIINNETKDYACIEGIHKGKLLINGTPTGNIVSRFDETS